MQRLFFHNPHDKASRDMLATMPEDVQIYTMFKDELPDIPIRAVPLLVDKQIILLTEPPYTTGGFVLQFQLQDHLGNNLIDDHEFYIKVEGEGDADISEGGILSLSLASDYPITLAVEITGEGFMPWRGEIAIEAV